MFQFVMESRYKFELISDPTQADVLIVEDWDPQWKAPDKVKILWVSEKELTNPFITEFKKEGKFLGYLHPIRMIAEVGERLKPILDQQVISDEVEDIGSTYCRINTALLVRVVPLKSDIFIKLSETKYLKIFSEGDVFDQKDLKRYFLEKKLEYFYIQREEIGEFLEKFALELVNLIQSKQFSGNKNISEVCEAVHETVQGLIAQLGPTPEIQNIIKNNVQLLLKSKVSPKLKDLFARIEKDSPKYISGHSVLLGQLSCTVAAAMGWNSDTTYHKLTLAAFLHDLSLKNNKLAAVQTLQELETRKAEFTADEYKAYALHPQVASDLAKQFTEIPPDVDLIVLQHHERPDETGFPRKLSSARISPLAAIFIVAHEMLHFMYANPEADFDREKFIKKYGDYFSSGNFKKVLSSLEKLTSLDAE
jgi:HD-GYP domain-containing protein (c-di-GMP phosphodiesterase class II)